MSSLSNKDLQNHQNLIIILSTILGFIGIVLIAILLILTYRYRQCRPPFGDRGASPINDDEIASWRKSGIDRKMKPPKIAGPIYSSHDPESTQLATSPGWTWSVSAPPVITPPPPSATIPARAPNARTGLTDETVPGQIAFIPPVKRQSSRLSKAPPGHGRTKSRGSSMSIKSTKSMRSTSTSTLSPGEPKNSEYKLPTCYDLEEKTVGSTIYVETDRTSSTFGNSAIDDLSLGGGLSPRPRTQPRSPEHIPHFSFETGRRGN